MDESKIKVEVAFALPETQTVIALEVEPGTTAQKAVVLSGLLEKFPQIHVGGQNKLGIFGKLVKGDTVLRDKDRVEIYRPLLADPKEVRRRRAAEGKPMKKGGE
jgi:putative ubiquitin-RnfH superfamily antitoxin RatB of RatAB toxin-antitoxin module